MRSTGGSEKQNARGQAKEAPQGHDRVYSAGLPRPGLSFELCGPQDTVTALVCEFLVKGM